MHLCLAKPVRELVPGVPGQDHPEVGNGDGVAIDRIVVLGADRVGAGTMRDGARLAMGDQLVTEEVEVHPVRVAAPLGALQEASVEPTGLLDVSHGEGEMERGESGTAGLAHARDLTM
jgi:hypothetical protein